MTLVSIILPGFAVMLSIVVLIMQIREGMQSRKMNYKIDTFLNSQGRINNAVLDAARATKILAASIGSEAIRTMKGIKETITDSNLLKDTMKPGEAGPDSGTLSKI